MRTTITLDDDVAAAIDRLRRTEGRSLRQVVNEVLRLGLARRSAAHETSTPVRTRSASLGGCRLANVEDVAEVLAIAEDEDRS